MRAISHYLYAGGAAGLASFVMVAYFWSGPGGASGDPARPLFALGVVGLIAFLACGHLRAKVQVRELASALREREWDLSDLRRKARAREQEINAEREEWRLQRESHLALVDMLPVAVCETDLKANVVFINNWCTQLYGYSEEDAKSGLSVMNTVVPEERERIVTNSMKIMKETRHRPLGAEYKCMRKDGSTFDGLIYARPIKNDDELRGMLVAIVDITRQKQTEKALKEAQEEAIAASRAKSEFLACMSHELRTPLNAIIGFSEVLHGRYLGLNNDKYVEYAGDIRASATHLLELVNDLLDISAIEAGQVSLHKQIFPVRDVLSDCVNLLAARAQSKKLHLTMGINDDTALVEADRKAIKQILINLLTNAVKFTPEGGRVAVLGNVKGDRIAITVADTGCGIPADQLSVILNPFARVEQDPFKVEEGWGLGLAITKSLIEQHDGELSIESDLGSGTMITVELPLAQEAVAISA